MSCVNASNASISLLSQVAIAVGVFIGLVPGQCYAKNANLYENNYYDHVLILPGNYKDNGDYYSASFVYENDQIGYKGIEADGGDQKIFFKRALLLFKENTDVLGDIDVNNANGIYTVVDVGANTASSVSLRNVAIQNSILLTNYSNYYGIAEYASFFNASYAKRLSVNSITVKESHYGYKTGTGATEPAIVVGFWNSNIVEPIEKILVESVYSDNYGSDLYGVSFRDSNICDGVKEIIIKNLEGRYRNDIGADLVAGLYFLRSTGDVGKVYVDGVKNNGEDSYGISARYRNNYSVEEISINDAIVTDVISETDVAYGVFAKNIKFNGNLIINNIKGKKDSLAIYVEGVDENDVNSTGVQIDGNANSIVMITGDIFNEGYESSNDGEHQGYNTRSRINANFLNKQSFLEGAIRQKRSDHLPGYGISKFNFANGAQWRVTGDSYLTDLRVTDKATVFVNHALGDNNQYEGYYNNINVVNLNVNCGVFNLSYDHNSLAKTNHLHVYNEANGTINLVLDVRNGNSIGKMPDSRYRYLITQLGGTLTLGEVKFKPGAARVYDVSFWEDGKAFQPGITTSTGKPGRWVVTNGRDVRPLTPLKPALTPLKPALTPLKPATRPWVPIQPGITVEPKPPVTPEVDQILSLSASVAQGLGMLSETEDLRMRMGEIRNGVKDGLWVRTYARKDRAYGSFGNGFEQDTSGIHVGIDHVTTKGGASSWLLGGAFHYGRANLDGAEATGGGEAKVDQYSAKAYATYLDNSGAFADIVAHIGYYETALSGDDNTDMGKFGVDYSNWSYGISGEVGKRFEYCNQRTRWFVEPSTQLTWFHAKGRDFTSTTGLHIAQGDADFLTARVGTAIGKTVALGSGADPFEEFVSFSLKGGLLYQFNGEQQITAHGTDDATVAAKTLDIKGTRAYYGLTADWKIDSAWRIYGQLSREEGSGYTKDYDVSAGIRYSF